MTENTISNEIANVELASTTAIESAIDSFRNNQSNVLSSFTGGDHKSKLAQLAALQGATKVKDELDKVFNLRNFIIQPVDMPDENTGELKATVRVILVDDKNKARYGFGLPLMNSLQDIVAMMEGMPDTWEAPVPVKVTKSTSRKGFEFFDLQVVI